MAHAPARGRLLPALTVGLLLGAGVALLQWRLACRVPDAEACVWGRAYLPVSLVLGGLAGMVVAAIVHTAMRSVQRGGSQRRPDSE